MNTRIWVSALALISLFSLPMLVFAQGQGLGVPAPQFAGTANPTNLQGAVVGIINILLTVAALVAAVFLIIGGIRYIASQGDEDQTEKAKNTILYAIIGLIVIGLAAAVVNFIVGAISSVK